MATHPFRWNWQGWATRISGWATRLCRWGTRICGKAGRGGAAAGWAGDPCGRDGGDYRDVLEWADSLWGAAVCGGAEWGAGVGLVGRGAEAAGAAGVQVEDGDSATAGWTVDRLDKV